MVHRYGCTTGSEPGASLAGGEAGGDVEEGVEGGLSDIARSDWHIGCGTGKDSRLRGFEAIFLFTQSEIPNKGITDSFCFSGGKCA